MSAIKDNSQGFAFELDKEVVQFQSYPESQDDTLINSWKGFTEEFCEECGCSLTEEELADENTVCYACMLEDDDDLYESYTEKLEDE